MRCTIEDYLEHRGRFERMTRGVAAKRTIREGRVVERDGVQEMDVLMTAPGFRPVLLTVVQPVEVRPEAEPCPA